MDPSHQQHSLRPGHGWGDHALVCGCGGDRVTRHNLVRDVVHSAANDKACLGAVLEKPGLLPVRHSDASFKIAQFEHPSQGKRARDLEAGSRTIRVTLLFSWFVSVVRVCALID